MRKSFLGSLVMKAKVDAKFMWQCTQASLERYSDFVKPMFSQSPPSAEDRKRGKRHTLASFEGETDVEMWKTETDYKKGGNSVCRLALGKNPEGFHMEFSGELRNDKELDYKEGLFAETTLRRLPRKKYRGYNGLQVELQTDGNPFRVHLAQYLYFNTELYYIDIIDRSKTWTVLEAPLANFRNASANRFSDATQPADEEMTYTVLGLKFGIYSSRQRTGSFRASVKSFSLIHRPDFDHLQYAEPFMFKKMDDYANAKYVDTGFSLIDVRKQKPDSSRVSLSYPDTEESERNRR